MNRHAALPIPAEPAAVVRDAAAGAAEDPAGAASEGVNDDAADGTAEGAGAGPLPPHAWGERSRELAHLLGRSSLGDRRAFAALYDRTSGYLFAVVLRIQRDRALAEEVLQEVYVTLWRQAASFDAARSQPLTWLTHIARHRAIDSLRRAEAQPRSLVPVAGTGGDSDDGDAELAQQRALEALPDESAGPLELLRRASEARQLGLCMDRLSASQRQSVALAFYDGLSHVEVAAQLRQPLGTVKSWVRRALLSLRACLDQAARRDAGAHAAAGAAHAPVGSNG